MIHKSCTLCPRRCGVDRSVKIGCCGMHDDIYVARAALHFWEEPCISGTRGSGTVFFSGCSMKCIYCQNCDIAIENFGKNISTEKLAQIFLNLQNDGAHNINLVTPTHYADKIIASVALAKKEGLCIPIVYNSSGYENEDVILSLKDTVDIFMPDFKYWVSDTAREYSNCPDYPTEVKKAIDAMYSLCPEPLFDDEGIMQKGVIVRHLLLPGHVYEAKKITEYIYHRYSDKVYMSLMSQYTPMEKMKNHPLLGRKVRKKEYQSLVDYAIELGMENVYIQEGEAADESFIPPFTLEGV